MITGEGAVAVTVNVRVALPVPAVFVALMVTLKVPATVGVPEIKPVVGFMVRPTGRPEAAKLVGEFVAVI